MIQLWQSVFWMWKSHVTILAGKGWLTVDSRVYCLRARETASGGKETMSPEQQSKLNSLCEQIFLHESIKAIPSWHISELWEQLELDSLKDKERFF